MRDAALAVRRLAVPVMGVWLLVGCELPGLLDPDPSLIEGTTLAIDSTGRATFEGPVESVHLDAGAVMLMDSVAVRVGEETAIPEDAELGHIEAVYHAVEAGDTIIARGSGAVETDSPVVIAADSIVFENISAPRVEFEGIVAAIDLDSSTVTFDNGTVLRILDTTEIPAEFGIGSLADAATALGEGDTLVAWGRGRLEGEEPRTVAASRVVFKVREPEPVEFEGIVAEIGLDSAVVVFESGTVIRLGEDTRIDAEHGIETLAQAHEALEAGDTVVAWGYGTLEHEEPRVIRAHKITFKARDPNAVDFEGHVTAIEADSGRVVLDDSVTVHVVDATEISNDYELSSLAAAKDALDAGHDVVAWGHGTLETDDPHVITAAKITFKAQDGGG